MATRLMCGRLGVIVHYSAPYAHHMLGKAERPWRTLRDNASTLLHNMSVQNSMWACAINTVVHLCIWCLRWRSPHAPHVTRARRVQVPCLRVQCLRQGARQAPSQAWGESVSRPWYRIYNHVTRRITTSVHVVFQEDVPGYPPSMTVDSLIFCDPDIDGVSESIRGYYT
jgi:hypothetical protein